MSNTIFVGDLHLSSRTPASRIDNYSETVFKKLESLLELAISKDVDTIIFTGDFFDSYYEPISYINKVVDILAKFKDKNIKILSLIGNHDLPYNNMEYFSSTPLSLLFKSQLVEKLDYISKDNIEIFGLHFSEKAKLESFKTSPDKTSILVMHYAFNNTVPGESINTSDLTGFDIVVAGHDHMPYDQILACNDSLTVLRPGSFTRQTKDKYNLIRELKVYLLKSTGAITLIKLPNVEPAVNIFSNKVLVEEALNLYKSNSLTNLFKDSLEESATLYDIFNIIESLTIPVTKESKEYIIKFLKSRGINKKEAD